MYRSAGGTITGNLAGKLINFSARPGRAGGQPPPGEYDIHPPVNDPVYGWVALMTPSGNLGSDLNKHKVSPSFMKVSPSFLKEAPSGMKDVPALGFQKVEPAAKICFAPAIKYCYSPKTNVADGGRFASGVKGTPGTARTVFVLSSRPILGQNSLVVMLGHADLMDALQSAGGATVTVS
jgi:hypothetical protein